MSERQPIYPDTPKFKPSPEFGDAFHKQVETVESTEFAKGTEEMQVPKSGKEETSSRLKKGSLRYKTGEDIAKGLAEAGKVIEKQKRRAEASRQRMMKAFDKRTDKILVQKREVSKSKTPEAKKRHQDFLKRFDERTDEVLSQKSREKNRVWKSLVETYLAGGARAVQEHLFDPARTGKSLTREMVQKDLALQKQLGVFFAADSKKRTLEDFMAAVPTEQNYVQEAKRAIQSGAISTESVRPKSSRPAEDDSAYEPINISEDEEETELEASDIIEDTDEQELTEEDLIPESVVKSSQGAQAADASGEIENESDIHRPVSMTGADLASSGRHFHGVKKIDPAGKFEHSNLYEVDEEEEKRNKQKLNASLSDRYAPGKSKVIKVDPTLDFESDQTIEIDPAYQQEIKSAAKEGGSFADRRHATNEQLAEAAQQAYIEAYRKYDPDFTNGKPDDLIALTKPPFFAFGAQAKDLKNLYKEMEKLRKIAVRTAGDERVMNNLATNEIKKNPKDMIRPELAVAAKESNKRDEETEVPQYKTNVEVDKMLGELDGEDRAPLIPVNKFLERKVQKTGETKRYLQAVKERSGMNPNFSSPLTRGFQSKKTVKEGIAYINQEAENKRQVRLAEIRDFFMKKKGMSDAQAHNFLMGPDIKGWFKGKEKDMQVEYKSRQEPVRAS